MSKKSNGKSSGKTNRGKEKGPSPASDKPAGHISETGNENGAVNGADNDDGETGKVNDENSNGENSQAKLVCINAEEERKSTSIRTKLGSIKGEMKTVNRLHFIRNNPCHTQRFYHEFIEAIGGYDEWQKLRPEIRSAWNAAAGSFDKQYGLIKAWSAEEVNTAGWFKKESPCEKPDVEALNKTADELKKLADRLEKLLKSAVAAKVDADTLTRSTVKKLSELAAEMSETAEGLVPKQADSKKPKQKN